MDKLEVRAILASAVGEGIMIRREMKNHDKTQYWYFQKTEVKKDEKKQKDRK